MTVSPSVADPAVQTAPPSSLTQGGDWPRTTRVLPWLLALFVVMIFLIPFDQARLGGSLPFDLKLDRVFLVPIAICWFAAAILASGASPRFRRSPLNLAVLLFATIAVTSVVINLGTLVKLDELDLAIKKLILLGSLVAFFFIVATVVRPREVPAFALFLVVLAAIAAFGITLENRTGTNYFFDLSDKLLPGIGLESRESSVYFDDTGRRNISGPTSHGLAATTMLAMILPFGIVGAMQARERRARLLYLAATALILAGALGTVRKSAGIVPFIPPLVLLAYRPRAMLRLLPFGILMIFAVHLIVPGAIGSIRNQLFPKGGFLTDVSSKGRTEDYDAVRPDLMNHLALGRGFGTYDPKAYRLLDNQYLATRIQMGYIGLASYLAIFLALFVAAHRLIRSNDRMRAPPALAAAGAAAAAGVASALFDALAFAHVPYLLLFIAGLVVAASDGLPVRHGRLDPAAEPAAEVPALTARPAAV
jgi:O-antigen ligase